MNKFDARLALTDEGGEVEGTILAVSLPEKRADNYGPGEMTDFFPICIITSKHDMDSLGKLIRKKRIVWSKTDISEKTLGIRMNQRTDMRIKYFRGDKVNILDIIHKPKWDRLINIDVEGVLVDTPKTQWPKVIVKEEILI